MQNMAIQNFDDKDTEDFFYDGIIRKGCGWMHVQRVAARKLDMVHTARRLRDLMAPPNNRLEALRGNLTGYHSIRINDQWRIVFRWTESGPANVRICDYH